MTTAPVPPTPEAPPVPVKPKANSKLGQLHALYADAKAKADAANEELKVITDGIKLELAQVDPEQRRFELQPANGITAPVLRLVYSESWRLDTKRVKAEHPEIWTGYAKQSGSWTLKAVPGSAE